MITPKIIVAMLAQWCLYRRFLRKKSANRAQYTKMVDRSIYTTLCAIIVVATFLRQDSIMSSQAGMANIFLFIVTFSTSILVAVCSVVVVSSKDYRELSFARWFLRALLFDIVYYKAEHFSKSHYKRLKVRMIKGFIVVPKSDILPLLYYWICSSCECDEDQEEYEIHLFCPRVYLMLIRIAVHRYNFYK